MKWAVCAFIVLCCVLSCTQVSAENSICSDAPTCDTQGQSALHRGDLQAAQKFFEEEVSYVEDANNKLKSVNVYNDLILVYIKMHDYESALKWTWAALAINPVNKETKNYFKQITNSYSMFKSKTGFSGIYVRYIGRSYWDQLRISEEGSGGNNFGLELYRIGPKWREYGPSQIGVTNGSLTKIGYNEFLYKGDSDFPSCQIHFRFRRDTVILSQDGDCGFGYGLQADGTFGRIASSRRK